MDTLKIFDRKEDSDKLIKDTNVLEKIIDALMCGAAAVQWYPKNNDDILEE